VWKCYSSSSTRCMCYILFKGFSIPFFSCLTIIHHIDFYRPSGTQALYRHPVRKPRNLRLFIWITSFKIVSGINLSPHNPFQSAHS
jgi:hypothetical protein